jgi:glycosyltransferase involved in cell wall biosynthesis
MKNAVEISVVICTFNRATMLGETLESYAAMAAGCTSMAELIIVDNNSTDDTEMVARSFLTRQKNMGRYLYEPTAGLSHARNLGISEAQSGIVAFVDDDVFFEPGWTDAIVRAFREHEGAGCVGGHTTPYFETGTPPWMHPSFAYMYGSTVSGETPHWMEYPAHPFGVNMAFRRKELMEEGGFDTRLGRIRDNLLSSEESLLFWRFHHAGRGCWFAPDAKLRHRIPADRTTVEWVLRRSYWQGISDIVFQQITEPKGPLALLGDAAATSFNLIRDLLGGKLSPRRIYWHYKRSPTQSRIWQAYKWGKIKQSLRESLRYPRPDGAPPGISSSTANVAE